MAHRDEIVQYMNEYLSIGDYRDYCKNGLQIEGTEEVHKIVTAVSCSLELFEKAAEKGAQMIVVHHGLIWNMFPGVITGVMKKRIKALFDRDMNLCGYHLPLDGNQTIGHSALIAKGLGIEEWQPFGEYNGVHLGVKGEFANPVKMDELCDRLKKTCGRDTLVLGAQRETASSVAILSGGGGDYIEQAYNAGVDVFISGEGKEQIQAFCRETGLTFVEAGHYNSEVPGIVALGELVASKFNVDVEFIDIPNPV